MRPSFGPNPHKGRLRCPTNCDAHLPESNFQTHSRACLKIHSWHLHAPLRGIFGPNSGYIAHYAPFIWPKSPTNCDAHLPESNFQTHSSSSSGGIRCLKVFYSIFLQTSTKIREEFATVQGVSELLHRQNQRNRREPLKNLDKAPQNIYKW